MKVRIKFSKQGEMRFIGHLDLMRYFQKVMRISGIDIRFSEGLSPHMIMSFASPLGVGLTSLGEYVDIDVRTPVTTDRALQQLNSASVDGIEFLDFRQIPEGRAANAMSLVAAADYNISFRAGSEPAPGWPTMLQAFLEREHIEVLKKTKKGEKQTDIRPMILECSPSDNSARLRLLSGSENNLKPELLMEAFASANELTVAPYSLLTERLDLLARREDGAGFCSLNDLGSVITDADL